MSDKGGGDLISDVGCERSLTLLLSKNIMGYEELFLTSETGGKRFWYYIRLMVPVYGIIKLMKQSSSKVFGGIDDERHEYRMP